MFLQSVQSLMKICSIDLEEGELQTCLLFILYSYVSDFSFILVIKVLTLIQNLKDENPGGQHTQFGDALSGKYFGGPILDMSLQQWQESFYTRANGDIIGANYSFPFDMNKIVRATAVMQGPGGSQSGLWVGPRLLLSTLHLQKWAQDSPTDAELQAYVDSVQLFEVESEITSVVLNNHAPKARLIDFSAKHDLGLFQLLDNYSDTVHHVTADSLIEVDEFYELHPQPGLKAACVGYSGRISESEAAQLRQVAQGVVQQRLQYSANLVSISRH